MYCKLHHIEYLNKNLGERLRMLSILLVLVWIEKGGTPILLAKKPHMMSSCPPTKTVLQHKRDK